MDAVLPAVSATVRHFEAAFTATKDLDPAVRKALRRRARRSMAQQPGEELDTMFKARCSTILGGCLNDYWPTSCGTMFKAWCLQSTAAPIPVAPCADVIACMRQLTCSSICKAHCARTLCSDPRAHLSERQLSVLPRR